MAGPAASTFWMRRARVWAIAVNLAQFWQKFLPFAAVINLLLAAFILVARRGQLDLAAGLCSYAAALAAAAAFALWQLRGHRYTVADALLRIETALGLQNRLSCARAGVIDWPPASLYRGRIARFRAHVAMLPLLGSAAFILAALWLPIHPPAQQGATSAAVEPTAWTQVADWAQLLRQERVVAEEAVEKLEERVGELRQRPGEEWYRPASLEAGEALRDQTQLAMRELAKQLQTAATLLEEAGERQAAGTLAAATELDEALRQQLQQLQAGQFPLSEQTLAQLQALGAEGVQALSAEQLKEMQERLESAAQNYANASGLEELDMQAVVLMARQAASGEVKRGPGPAPLVMSTEGTGLQAARQESVSNPDMRNAVIGETVSVTSRPGNDPEEKTFTPNSLSGAASAPGDGGNVVWQEGYTPQERAVLEKYFK